MKIETKKDRFPNETEEVKREEEKKFKEVGEAYSVLSDNKKRSQYDSGVDLEEMGGSGMGHSGMTYISISITH